MPWRRRLVGVVLALAAACSGPVDHGDPLAAPPTVEAPTSTTTTTTAPPPADIQDLIAGTTMTERARRIFLASSPAIEDVDTFVRNCAVETAPAATGEVRTHTQGCYVAGRIHLLAPDRPEGHELLYVVAAHELLHAAYAQLRPAEREAIDAEVVTARAGNERLEDRLRPYGSGPTLVNEMHAILGSEFEALSATLEAHYAQYFTNRAAVVAARQRTLGAREDEIRRLRAEIDALDARLIDLKVLQERLRAAGNAAAFNANVATYNGVVERYNGLVDRLNAVVADYNSLLGR